MKASIPRGGLAAALPARVTRGPTVIVLAALFPTASVTVTTSVVLPVVPAVYRPAASTLPPEPLVVSA